MSDKNKTNWNDFADKYSEYCHSAERMNRLTENPQTAFHPSIRELLRSFVPDLRGKKVLVPPSGDNHAVFAFAMLGARVLSSDISENQLANAERAAKLYNWGNSISFACSDTIKLAEIRDEEYDLVYISNGAHVWLNDLRSAYRNIFRVMKPGGHYIMYEVHPFMRPFGEKAEIIKPYDEIGPFENEYNINYHWRVTDLINALVGSGLILKRIDEVYAEKDYDSPFWVALDDKVNGVRFSRDEVDRMYDWRHNPLAALPNFICAAAEKPL